MSDIGKISGLFEQIAKWFNNRPQRLKEQALEAAFQYIQINETSKYKEKKISQKKKSELLLHFKKQFMSWKDGS